MLRNQSLLLTVALGLIALPFVLVLVSESEADPPPTPAPSATAPTEPHPAPSTAVPTTPPTTSQPIEPSRQIPSQPVEPTLADDPPPRPPLAVQLTPPKVQGNLQASLVGRVIKSHTNSIRYCFKGEATATTTIAVQFEINPTGKVSTAKLTTGADDLSTATTDCLIDAYRRLTFPQPSGKQAVVVHQQLSVRQPA